MIPLLLATFASKNKEITMAKLKQTAGQLRVKLNDAIAAMEASPLVSENDNVYLAFIWPFDGETIELEVEAGRGYMIGANNTVFQLVGGDSILVDENGNVNTNHGQ